MNEAFTTRPSRTAMVALFAAVLHFCATLSCSQPNSTFTPGSGAAAKTSGQKRPVDYVNPLIGTAPLPDKQYLGNNPAQGEELYYGCVNPGAMVTEPNGKICVGPVSGFDGQRYHVRGSGYRFTDTTLMGFTNLNGEYHDDNKLLFMPTVGPIKTIPGTRDNPFEGYRSAKDTGREKASPGYYTVFLTTYSVKDAAANLLQEIPAMDFDRAHRIAEQGWSELLEKATVEGGTEGEKTNYYTAVYRQNGYFRGRALGWGDHSTGPKPAPFRGSWGGGYWGPGSTGGVVGNFKKGLSTIDINAAYAKLRNDALTGGGAAGIAYRKYGYIPDSAGVKDYVNRSIGLAYEDYALSELASIVGNAKDHAFFLARSRNYKKLYNPATGFFTPRPRKYPLKNFLLPAS